MRRRSGSRTRAPAWLAAARRITWPPPTRSPSSFSSSRRLVGVAPGEIGAKVGRSQECAGVDNGTHDSDPRRHRFPRVRRRSQLCAGGVPPAAPEVVAIVDAPVPPVAHFSPDAEVDPLRPVGPAAADRRSLAPNVAFRGTRIDPAANASFQTNYAKSLAFRPVAGKDATPIALPAARAPRRRELVAHTQALRRFVGDRRRHRALDGHGRQPNQTHQDRRQVLRGARARLHLDARRR